MEKITKVADVPKGGMRGFVVNGKKILVAESGGKFYAIASACTHMHGPLEKGMLEGSVVTCPWHGSQFDVTSGKVVRGPATKDEERIELTVENGDILVNA